MWLSHLFALRTSSSMLFKGVPSTPYVHHTCPSTPMLVGISFPIPPPAPSLQQASPRRWFLFSCFDHGGFTTANDHIKYCIIMIMHSATACSKRVNTSPRCRHQCSLNPLHGSGRVVIFHSHADCSVTGTNAKTRMVLLHILSAVAMTSC